MQECTDMSAPCPNMLRYLACFWCEISFILMICVIQYINLTKSTDATVGGALCLHLHALDQSSNVGWMRWYAAYCF